MMGEKLMEGKKEIGLYIHIPFCKSKCYYCDFFSYSNKHNLAEEYVQCLQREMKHYAHENKILSEHQLEGKYCIKTIYFFPCPHQLPFLHMRHR